MQILKKTNNLASEAQKETASQTAANPQATKHINDTNQDTKNNPFSLLSPPKNLLPRENGTSVNTEDAPVSNSESLSFKSLLNLGKKALSFFWQNQKKEVAALGAETGFYRISIY